MNKESRKKVRNTAQKTIARRKTKEKWRVNVGMGERNARLKCTRSVSSLLKKWIREKSNLEICPVCGEDMPETFHVHHIDGNHNNNSNNNKIYICASCHAITYKAKKDLRKLWKRRHAKYKVSLSKRKDAKEE